MATWSLFPGFSLEIVRGDKIGVIGNNGRGTGAFFKMLLVIPPDFGTVELGHQAAISYFPQNHEKS